MSDCRNRPPQGHRYLEGQREIARTAGVTRDLRKFAGWRLQARRRGALTSSKVSRCIVAQFEEGAWNEI